MDQQEIPRKKDGHGIHEDILLGEKTKANVRSY